MERRRLVMQLGSSVTCELLAVVRDHHDHMPGAERDRPGMDRIQVRTPEGDVIAVDGFGARNGTNTANAASVSLANTGELLWASVPKDER